MTWAMEDRVKVQPWCSRPRSRGVWGERGSTQQHRTKLFRLGCTWATIGGLVGPLGAQPILSKPNLVGA